MTASHGLLVAGLSIPSRNIGPYTGPTRDPAQASACASATPVTCGRVWAE